MTARSNLGLYDSGTYIPFRCQISDIALGETTVITTTVNNGFVTGNVVQFIIPQIWGTIQLNGKKGTVISVTSNTLTVNIDSRSFDAFVTPVSTGAIDYPQVIPIGDSNSGYQLPGGSSPTLRLPGAFRNTFP